MSNNDRNSPPIDGPSRPRRSSVTQQTFNSIFGGGRANSTSGAPTGAYPGPITTAVAQEQRRRGSVATLGLSGTSPTQMSPFSLGARRGSVSTAGSDSIDENAIDDEEGPSRSNPTTPFVRRMSFGAQALRRAQPDGTSPGRNGRSSSYTTAPALPTIPSGPRSVRATGSGAGGGGTTPPNAQNQALQASTQSKPRTGSDFSVSARPGEGGGFNWSEQLRSRAESVSQPQRPNFSNTAPAGKQMHERQKSVSDMPAPPTAVPSPPAPKPARKQPDAFGERILKGDFYMD